MKRLVLLAMAAILFASGAQATRIKDISTIQSARENQLIGYGLVVGLQGTGDSMRNSPFTQHALQSMLDRICINTRRNVTKGISRNSSVHSSTKRM